VTETRTDPEYWPKGTLQTGSWKWARDVQPPLVDIRRSTPDPTLSQQLATLVFEDSRPRII
jgi:hypothetical protein